MASELFFYKNKETEPSHRAFYDNVEKMFVLQRITGDGEEEGKMNFFPYIEPLLYTVFEFMGMEEVFFSVRKDKVTTHRVTATKGLLMTSHIPDSVRAFIAECVVPTRAQVDAQRLQ